MQPRARLLLLACGSLALIACGDDEPGGTGGAGSTGTGTSTTTTTASGATNSTSGTGGSGGAGGGGGDAGGSSTSTGGSGGAGGSGGDDGGGGAGGEAMAGLCAGGPVEDPLPVPGCESLVWIGEPVLLEVTGWPRQQAALLDDGDVGLLYVEGTDSGPIVSRRIESPFESWPPTVTEAVEHLPSSSSGVTPGFSARGDGTFSVLSAGVAAIGVLGEAGVGMTHDFGYFELDPRAGAGGYLATWGAAAYFDSVEPGASGVLAHTFEPPCQEPQGTVDENGELLLALTPAAVGEGSRCDQANHVASLVRVRPDGGEDLGLVDLGVVAWNHRLHARPGGAWLTTLVATNGPLHLCVVPLDADGAVAGPALRTPATRADISVARRGEGLVFAMRSDDTNAIGVTDGVHVTRSPVFAPDHASTVLPVDVVASSDGRSILASFTGIAPDGRRGIILGRADCVASD